MTTIAYRNGFLAADTVEIAEGYRVGTCEKIKKRKDGVLVGAGGRASYCEAFMDWVLDGEEDDPPAIEKGDDGHPDSGGIIIRLDGSVELWGENGSTPIVAEYVATGTGAALCLGAFAFGATAEEAVIAAIKHDIHSGGEVTVLRLGK